MGKNLNKCEQYAESTRIWIKNNQDWRQYAKKTNFLHKVYNIFMV